MSDTNRTPVPPTRHELPHGDRITILEAENAQVQRRLEEGARTFGELSEALEKIVGRVSQDLERVDQRFEVLATRIDTKIDNVVRSIDSKIDVNVKELDVKLDHIAQDIAPKRIRPLQLFLALFGIVVTVGTMIWAVSRYPERGEFNEAVKQIRDVRDDVRDHARDIQRLNDLLKRTP